MLSDLNLWLEQVHFLRPWWLLALIPAVGLAWALWRRQKTAGQCRQFVAPHLLSYLIEGADKPHKRASLLGLLALWVLAVVALAGPAWQKLPEPVQKGGSALVVLWDMSPSMLAQDLKPSRLVRSRLKLIDLLRARQEGTTGLIAYAGESHVVAPLTDDTRTVISLVSALSPADMPVSGSNPEMALQMANRLLKNAGVARGNILFLTDGIAPEAFSQLARIRRDADHQVIVWGLGTTEGAPIPLADGGFARNAAGEIVIAQLNETELQDFTADIGAYYVPFLQTNEDLETLATLFNAPADNLRETDRVFDNWYEHGPWLLLLILPFAALAFRRGWIMALPLFLLPLTTPQPAHAVPEKDLSGQWLAWDSLWQTPNQRAYDALQQQQPEKAAELFQDPAWKGTAAYRAERYEAALEAFKQTEPSTHSLYNQGNSLMQMQDYSAAIDAYDKALQYDPQNEDAKANRALAKKLLQQQRQQQQQQKQQQGDQGQDDQQKQSSDSKSDAKPAESEDQGQNRRGDDSDNSAKDRSNAGQPDQPYDDPSNNRNDDSENEQNQSAEESPQQAPEQPRSEKRGDTGDKQATEPQQAYQKKEQPGEALSQLSEDEREQQQALEQWLRKIPDDPSGLLRNKFLHEYRERRRTGEWLMQDNNADQRW